MDITNSISLVKADFAIANMQNEHVTRNQMMNIDPRGIDEIFTNKLENGFVPDSVIQRIAEQSAGITNQAIEGSYIEGGWGLPRGICKLTFCVTENVIEEIKVIIIGYLYGGSSDANDGITPDTMVVPVKSWQMKKYDGIAPNTGLPMTKTAFQYGNNVLLNNPQNLDNRGSVTLRPLDIVTNAQIVQYQMNERQAIDPSEIGQVACGNSLLQTQGMILSSNENDSSVVHAKKLLEASVRYNHNVSTCNNDSMGAIGDASAMPRLRECSPDANPVFSYIQHQFGVTYTSSFSGYSVGELTTIFPELLTPGFVNMTMMDSSRFVSLDRRLDNKEFGTTSYYEILATELFFIVLSELFERHISVLHFTATNNVPAQQAHLALGGVIIFSDKQMPLVDEDFELPMNVEILKQNIITQFFSRFDPYGNGIPNQLVSVDVNANLVGEIQITIWLNGDEEKGVSFCFAAWGSNRNNLNIGTIGSSTTVATNMFNNLTDHFSR